ncbi:MAG: YebC/PmpR family DNA-binding transcriptional regulator, partial [Defluviitaleaceae bacterium]|nr:YebC/PmpR family DNA-binding transcriptional regulator [Defluviitaleaceae bacterium]
KSANMPNDTIERSIKKAAGEIDSINYETIIYEGYGPCGIAIIAETLTDNRNRTVANVRNAFTKGGGNLGTSGSVAFQFDKIGLIAVERSETGFDEDEMTNIAIEAGASDFIVSDEGYEIITSPEDFVHVKSLIERAKIPVLSSEITMQPQIYGRLTNQDDIKKMNKLLELLEDDDDVQNVYHNWED